MIPAYLAQFRGSIDVDADDEAIEEIWQTVKELAPANVVELMNGDNAK